MLVVWDVAEITNDTNIGSERSRTMSDITHKDAVVVRCEGCKWFAEFQSNGVPLGRGHCNNPQNMMSKCPTADWFCADGERKEDG